MKQPINPTPASRTELAALVAGAVRREREAEEKLFALLHGHLQTTVSLFLRCENKDADDVVGETITVVFDHLRRSGGFDGDLIRFAITIARNRCRNILNRRKRRPQVPIEPFGEWVADVGRSPLDLLIEAESYSLIQKALDGMDKVCRLVLRAFYFEGRTIESIRRSLKLKTVQGVYHRRTVCLRRLGERLTARVAEQPG